MAKPLRFGTALTALGLIGAITACASPMNKAAMFGGRVNSGAVGVATRAQMAIQAGKFEEAIGLAEQSVEGSPQDAGFRALLGNAYFGAGRFASAETAYRDSLTIYGNQPQVVLKLALVSIAQGKNGAALSLLEAARGLLDPSDYGLALALAGQPADAVAVLNQAARAPGADGRVRQNLALAHALAGDWESARVVAAQDLAADQVDSRMQQWMAMATPAHSYDQVAALTGIAPAAADPGQPVRLALQLPQQQQQQQQQFAVVDPVPVVAAPPVMEPAPVMVEEVPLAVTAYAMPQARPLVSTPAPVIAQAQPEPVVAPLVEAVAEVPKPSLSPRAASFSEGRAPVRRASAPRPLKGASRAVVQLGAYSSKDRVSVAWNRLSAKFPSVRGYTPTAARFNSSNGTVYRLSVGGFASESKARDFCESLQSAGGKCFVRSIAGDSPVRFASR